MKDEDIHNVLKLFLKKIKGADIVWRLEGSANLRVQGVDVEVNDVDIVADSEGYAFLKKALSENVVSERYVEAKREHSLQCNIGGDELEVCLYDEHRLNMFGSVKQLDWRGLGLRVLPLQNAGEFYRMIGKEAKVSLIEEHMKNKKKQQ